jgi:thiol-disulfide isomerase/thioredoxin
MYHNVIIKRFALIGACILIGVSAFGCQDKNSTAHGDAYTFPEEEESSSGLADFTCLDLYGETVDQSIFENYEITLVNVWGTFCGPCLEEMPDLGRIKREYEERNVNVVGVIADLKLHNGSLDMNQIEKAKKIVAETQADYVHLVPSNNLEKGLLKDVVYIPHTVFVDSEGKIIGDEYVGSRSKEKWMIIIEELL